VAVTDEVQMGTKHFRGASWFISIAVFAALLAVSVYGIAVPAMWADEVATVSAAHRPLATLIGLLGNIDGVHGTYYLFIHFWGSLFGFSPLSVRLPSAIAVAITGVLTWKLAGHLYGVRIGWMSLVIVAVMPRLTWAATEARSYAFTSLIAVIMLWLFLKATALAGHRVKLFWIAYTFVSILGTYLFIYLILLNVAFGLWVLLSERTLASKFKHRLRRWAVSFGVQVAVSAFILWRAGSQQHQIHWLPPVDWRTVDEVLAGQVFWMAPAMAMVANGLILVYVLGTRSRQRSSYSTDALLALSVATPTAIVLVYSLVKTTIYDARYFSYTAPMVAILLAAGIEKLFARRVAIAMVMVLVLLAAPAYIGFRAPNSKLTDWNRVAAAISRTKAPGDAILYGDYEDPTPTVSRIHFAYPAAFDGLSDLSLRKPADKTWKLFDARKPVMSTASRWKSYRRIVLVEDGTHSAADLTVIDELGNQGFKQTRRIRLEPETVLVFDRGN